MQLKKLTGFTLIELMIVVAIIGILASIGYPSYQEHVIKSNRAEAKVALEGLAAAMERYYSDNNSYSGAAISGTVTVPYSAKVPKDGAKTNYTLSITSATSNGYSLKAKAAAGSPQVGDGDLTLAHTGARTWGIKNSWDD